MTLSAGDVIANMSLASLVQCVQKLVKLVIGLLSEHGQQLLVLTKGRHLSVDDIPLFCAENIDLIKFIEKSGTFDF